MTDDTAPLIVTPSVSHSVASPSNTMTTEKLSIMATLTTGR